MLNRPISLKLLYTYIIVTLVLLVIPTRGSDISIDDIHVLDVMRLDYLLHVLLFIPVVPLSRMSWPGRPWWLIITAGLLFAACSEFLHLLLPYRGYNITDLFANMAGAALGAFLSVIFKFGEESSLIR